MGKKRRCPKCGFKFKLVEPKKEESMWLMCDCWCCRVRTWVERKIDRAWFIKHLKYLKSLDGGDHDR